MKKNFIIFPLITMLVAVGGFYYLLRLNAFNTLEKIAKSALDSGDYLASLIHYSELEEDVRFKEAQEAKIKVTESINLLIAEEILTIAQGAAENGEWFEVKALLERSDATTNTTFKDYKKAIDLYLEAADKVKDLEAKIETELAILKEEATQEKKEREQVEERVTQIEKQVTQKEEELQIVIREKEATQTELQIQKAETDIAKQETEKERVKKFAVELGLYVGMLESGRVSLDEALTEINNDGKFALNLINEGKVLFDEVNEKGGDLLQNRTTEDFRGKVQTLLQSTALLVDASRSFGSAVFYINDKESDSFKDFINNGKSARNTALQLISTLNQFISTL